MAYTVTITQDAGSILAHIAGTAIAATTEATIDLGIERVTFLRMEARLVSGTGATIDPVLGSETDPATARNIATNGAAAAAIDFTPSTGAAAVQAPAGKLYYRDVVNAAADNVTEAWLYFRRGW